MATNLLGDSPSSSRRNLLVDAPEKTSPPVVDQPKVEAKPEKNFKDRAIQFGQSVLGGGVIGAAAPELTMGAGKAIATIPSPYAKATGYGMEAAGRMMKGQRGLAIGTGAIGGATGDIAGQAVEIKGGTPPAVFLAEMAGGVVGPAFTKTITEAVKIGFRKLAGMDSVSAAKKVVDDLGLNESVLSSSQRQFIKDQIERLRGGPPSSASKEQLADVLKTGATDITKQAERDAAALRRTGAEATTEAERRAEKMRLAGAKTTEIGAAAAKEAQAARANIGQEREASDIGVSLRDRIVNLFGDIAQKRSAEYNAQKAIRDTVVKEKEASGQLVKDLPEYDALLTELRNKLLIGREAQKATTAPVTEKGVLAAYQNIYDAVNSRRVVVGIDQNGNPAYKTFPTSFDALDDVRRRLGDVAFGKEVEGYSAIGANIAKDFYSKISNLQSKYAGESHDALQSGYEMASRLLDKYKSRAGKQATAADRFDPTRFSTDPASLPNTYFNTKQSVTDLIELTGGDKAFVVKEGSDFAVRQLRNKDLKGAQRWVDSNSDWLNALPEVKTKVDAYVKTLERGERIAGKSSTAAKILQSREPNVLREGERVLASSEKAAEAVTKEAADRVKTIMGDRNPAARMRDIILGGKPSEWAEVGPLLAQAPNGKALIADAVNQVMADRATGGLSGAIIKFREDVGPNLKAAGLMGDRQIASLEAQLQSIADSVAGEAAKLTLIQSAIKNAIIGVAAQPVGAGTVEAVKLVTPQSASDVLNRSSSVGSAAPRFR
jgi:hypothetical protein